MTESAHHWTFFQRLQMSHLFTRLTSSARWSGSDFMIWSNSANWHNRYLITQSADLSAIGRIISFLSFENKDSYDRETTEPDKHVSCSHFTIYRKKQKTFCLKNVIMKYVSLIFLGEIKWIRKPCLNWSIIKVETERYFTFPGLKKTFVKPNL